VEDEDAEDEDVENEDVEDVEDEAEEEEAGAGGTLDDSIEAWPVARGPMV